jgi:hypothetical protein
VSKYDSGGEYDHFAGGLTQPVPNLNVQAKPPKRGRYSDDEFLKIANAKGPDILKIVARDHK